MIIKNKITIVKNKSQLSHTRKIIQIFGVLCCAICLIVEIVIFGIQAIFEFNIWSCGIFLGLLIIFLSSLKKNQPSIYSDEFIIRKKNKDNIDL